MKKYFLSITIGILVGIFLSKTVLDEYEGYAKGKENSTTDVYFVKYGEYKSLDELEKNTLSLTNYIYLEKDNKYCVYISMTLKKEVLDKLLNYFKSINYNVSYEVYKIDNKILLEYLQTTDKLFTSTSEPSVLGEVSSQTLSKYEEYVINGSKN